MRDFSQDWKCWWWNSVERFKIFEKQFSSSQKLNLTIFVVYFYQAGQTTFFSRVQPFLLILNFFHWFCGWNPQKISEKEQKNVFFSYFACSSKLVDSLRGYLKFDFFWLIFLNKKGWKRLKKVLQPALECAQHPKHGWNTQHPNFR